MMTMKIFDEGIVYYFFVDISFSLTQGAASLLEVENLKLNRHHQIMLIDFFYLPDHFAYFHFYWYLLLMEFVLIFQAAQVEFVLMIA